MLKPGTSYWLFVGLLTATAAVSADNGHGLSVADLFNKLGDQFQSDDNPKPSYRPDFQGMLEDGNRQLRRGVQKRPGHAFTADTLISMHQGSRQMTLRMSEGLGDDCAAPTTIRRSNQTVAGPPEMAQFIGGEWDLLAFYDADSCRVLDVELVQPGMSDFVIDNQLAP